MAEIVRWYGDAFMQRVREELEHSLFEAAVELVEGAAAKAPRLSGRLAESGYAATKGRSTYTKRAGYRKAIRPPEGVAVAAFAMFYAPMVELGTRRTGAQPFIRPTFDARRESLAKNIVVRMREKVNK